MFSTNQFPALPLHRPLLCELHQVLDHQPDLQPCRGHLGFGDWTLLDWLEAVERMPWWMSWWLPWCLSCADSETVLHCCATLLYCSNVCCNINVTLSYYKQMKRYNFNNSSKIIKIIRPISLSRRDESFKYKNLVNRTHRSKDPWWCSRGRFY